MRPLAVTRSSPPRLQLRLDRQPSHHLESIANSYALNQVGADMAPQFRRGPTLPVDWTAGAFQRQRVDHDAWGISSRRSKGHNGPSARELTQPSRSEHAMRMTIDSRSRRRARLLVPLVSSLALVALLASPAQAGRYVDRAVASLGRDPVYVDAGARRAIPAASVSALRERVRQAGTPVYVALLPAAALREAGGNAD